MSRGPSRLAIASVLAAALLLVSGCPLIEGWPALPINVGPRLLAQYLTNDAAHPAGLAFTPDGRVLYTEKETGRIRVIKEGRLLEQPFAEVPVNYARDRGLLGIAVHPNFNLNNRVYVFYTRADVPDSTAEPNSLVDNRVVYFQANEDVSDGAEFFVASLPAHGDGRRVGGRLAFATDGTLLVALGDLGDHNAAPDLTRLAGKVLRFNDDGSLPWNNPDPNSPVYARGFRDPLGLAIDPESGAPFLSDRCEDREHEIDRIEAGKDYGWPAVNGLATTTAELQYQAANPDYVDPILDSNTDGDPYVGVAFNPSTKYGPSTRGRLFTATRDGGLMYQVRLSGSRNSADSVELFATGFPTPITDVAFTSAGTLYVASRSAVLRVVPYP